MVKDLIIIYIFGKLHKVKKVITEILNIVIIIQYIILIKLIIQTILLRIIILIPQKINNKF